ncbi:MAG: hypothetical protein NVSMB46_00050 [Candidatus Saccharimonadales bacterium]
MIDHHQRLPIIIGKNSLRNCVLQENYFIDIDNDPSSINNPLQRRANEIRLLVDPHGTLPEISLSNSTLNNQKIEVNDRITKEYALNAKNELVGVLYSREAKNSVDTVEIALSLAHTKGQGYGTAMYLQKIISTLNQGKALQNDYSGVSLDGARMWLKLVKMGVAEEIQPFKLDPYAYEETYMGQYVVTP